LSEGENVIADLIESFIEEPEMIEAPAAKKAKKKSRKRSSK